MPEIRRELSNEAKGTLLRVDPAEDTEVKAGSTVAVIVSAGAPLLAFDDDEDILVVDSGTGKKRDPIATGTAQEKDPAWSPTGPPCCSQRRPGHALQPRAAGRDADRADAGGAALLRPGLGARRSIATSWPWPGGPTRRSTCASASSEQREAMRVRCKEEPDFVIGRKISWAFDGKSLLAFGATNDLSEFGMVQWKTKKPFSPDRTTGRTASSSRTRPGGPRGARRRALARRRAPGGRRARRGRPLAALLRQAGRLQADGRRAAGRAGLQGDLAAGRARARGGPGRRLPRLGHG